MKCVVKNCPRKAIADEPYCDIHRYQGTPGTGYEGSQPTDPPIIISGGSVTIEFDETQLRETLAGKLFNPNKRIKRIEISGDDIMSFDEDTLTGKVTIKIFYGDP